MCEAGGSWILRVSRRHGLQFVGKRADIELAGAGRCSHVPQASLIHSYEGVRWTEHAPRNPCRILERRHGLAEIIKRGAVVVVERYCVTPPHPERELIIICENASRHG